MERLCKTAGVRQFDFHAIRHLTASILYRAGQPVAVIQAVLRHQSPQTTTRYLQSLGLKQTQEAMEAAMGKRGLGKVVSLQKTVQEEGESSGLPKSEMWTRYGPKKKRLTLLT